MQKFPYLLIFLYSTSPLNEGQGNSVLFPALGSGNMKSMADQRELLWKELMEAEWAVGLVVLLSEDAL